MSSQQIIIIKDGPYLLDAGVPIEIAEIETNDEGGSWSWSTIRSIPVEGPCALCRCGASSKKPFCDGTHQAISFDGTETSSREPFDKQVVVTSGPRMDLYDAASLCAFARFCDNAGSIWELIHRTHDPEIGEIVAHEASHCPSGRLVVYDSVTEGVIEPDFVPSIVLVEDPAQNCSGPIWARGGLRLVSADGGAYEVRNRMTLCRCGESSNKPFCDGQHADIRFVDGL